ncbi:MAG: TolC family protein [Bacteroidales bacterium]
MKTILFLSSLILSFSIAAQDTLSLNQLRIEAEKNYPNLKRKVLLEQTSEEQEKILRSNYYPQWELGGLASWQSDVTTLEIVPTSGNVPFSAADLFVIPEVSRENYKITVDVKQLIWDGGATRQARRLESASLETELSSLDTERYSIGETVNTLFFNLLMLQTTEQILTLTRKEFKTKSKALQSGIDNGTVAAWNADALQAEILALEQKQSSNSIKIGAIIEQLNILTGKTYSKNAIIEFPEPLPKILPTEILRPELKVYSAGIKKLEETQALLGKNRMPKIVGYGQAGYGMPGLNMFSNDFSPWAILGISVQWNPWDWRKNRREQAILGLKKEGLLLEKETLLQNIYRASALKRADILHYETLLSEDEAIIKLRKQVKEAAERQLEEGTITSTAYISEVIREKQAIMNKEMHRILWMQSNYEYLQTTGAIPKSM